MKKLFRLLPVLLIGFMMMTTSCEDDPEESCNKPDGDVENCSAEDISVCCDENGSCYYIYNGTTYQTVDDLAKLCATSVLAITNVKLQLDAFTKELIKEARMAADCK